MKLRPYTTTLALAALLSAPAAIAQEDDEKGRDGWHSEAEFSFVLTDGNSETSSLGFANKTTREWQRSSVTLKLGGVRAESTKTVSRFAVGTPAGFVDTRVDESETTAENYYLNLRYDRQISERLFWHAGAGWEQNRPSGFDRRLTAVAGVGHLWRDDEELTFKTDYALTWTDQKDVVINPAIEDSFLGARFSWAYRNAFGASTTYTNDFTFDQNLDESDDWRAEMVNAVAVAMNKRLALKVSLQWRYDDLPALDEVPLVLAPGQAPIGVVFLPKDELDTVFTTSLVVNF